MYKLTIENLTRVNNDVNGNPRYVFHFLALADHYGESVAIAKKLIGGKKYHTKSYDAMYRDWETKLSVRVKRLLAPVAAPQVKVVV